MHDDCYELQRNDDGEMAWQHQDNCIDGKLLAESKTGVPNRQGGQPRGGHIYADFRDDLNDGKVCIAVTSFLQLKKRGKPIPPSGHLTVWLEEQKIPPIAEAVSEAK